jgi:hypothetical protein
METTPSLSTYNGCILSIVYLKFHQQHRDDRRQPGVWAHGICDHGSQCQRLLDDSQQKLSEFNQGRVVSIQQYMQVYLYISDYTPPQSRVLCISIPTKAIYNYLISFKIISRERRNREKAKRFPHNGPAYRNEEVNL